MVKNLKIGTRLTTSFATILLLVIILMGIAVFNLNSVAKNMQKFYDTAYSAATQAWTARRDIRLLEASIYQAATTENQDVTDQAIQITNASGTSLADALAALKTTLPKAMTPIDNAVKLSAEIRPVRIELVDLLKSQRNNAALKIMNETYLPGLEKIATQITEIGVIADDAAMAFADDAAKTSNQIMLLMIGLAVLIAAFILAISVAITRSIVAPLTKVTNRIKTLCDGDLTEPMPTIEGKDEVCMLAASSGKLVEGLQNLIGDMTNMLGEMADGNMTVKSNGAAYPEDFAPLQVSMIKIVQSFNETLSQIDVASEQVSSGADQVASGAQALAQGATEQASSVQQLSASINEIAVQVNQNASNATNANNVADEVGNQITQSSEQMGRMIEAMAEINQSSQQIGKIIKTIEDIAFQTNILALNAAVEAARAGVAGKGFAVVADEVRSLASKSAEAAKQTTNMIENSVKSVEGGTKIADETAMSLGHVVAGATKITDLIQQISKSSNEQATAIAQVNLGVEQISSVVQTNSATSEESAAASEELSSQSTLLRGLVSRFRLH